MSKNKVEYFDAFYSRNIRNGMTITESVNNALIDSWKINNNQMSNVELLYAWLGE